MNRAGLGLAVALILAPALTSSTRIDRYALVSRHNPTLRRPDPLSPLSLGNGGFAFTADITGSADVPALLRSRRAAGRQPRQHAARHGIAVGLAFVPEPSRLHARRHLRAVRRAWPTRRVREPAGLCGWRLASREPAQDQPRASRLRDPQGRRFRGGTRRSSADGTDARPLDGHAVQPLLARRRAGAGRVVGASRPRSPGRARHARLLAFQSDWRAPRVSISAVDPQRRPSDWAEADRGRTVVARRTPHEIEWRRTLDETAYSVSLAWAGAARVEGHGPDWVLSFDRTEGPLEFVVAFSEQPIDSPLPDVESTRAASAQHWRRFWEQGGRSISRAAPIRAPPSSSVAWCCRST